VKSFTINGVVFEYDDTLPYLDFWVDAEGGHLVDMQWDVLFTMLVEGKTTLEELDEPMILMDRWIRDVPRKRFYRGLVKSGAHVMSGEFWFENEPDEEAEKIFQGLENTGNLARKFLEAFRPELAQKCRDDRYHPATKHYISP
jgi:hypothetical protein